MKIVDSPWEVSHIHSQLSTYRRSGWPRRPWESWQTRRPLKREKISRIYLLNNLDKNMKREKGQLPNATADLWMWGKVSQISLNGTFLSAEDSGAIKRITDACASTGSRMEECILYLHPCFYWLCTSSVQWSHGHPKMMVCFYRMGSLQLDSFCSTASYWGCWKHMPKGQISLLVALTALLLLLTVGKRSVCKQLHSKALHCWQGWPYTSWYKG